MYTVDFWAYEPFTRGNECAGSDDFDTAEQALSFYHDAIQAIESGRVFWGETRHTCAYVVVDGPDLHHEHRIVGFDPRDDSDDWQREIAMQAGMGGGVQAYNDAMGY